eukprot:7089279-Alexandrium_andersonii.AAC.1
MPARMRASSHTIKLATNTPANQPTDRSPNLRRPATHQLVTDRDFPMHRSSQPPTHPATRTH